MADRRTTRKSLASVAWSVGGASAITTAAVVAYGKGSASTHSIPGCGAANPIQDETVLEIELADDLTVEAQTAALFTAAAWDADTVLTLNVGGGETDLLYAQFNDPTDPGLAGQAFTNYIGYGCFIAGSKPTINPTHFTAGNGPVTADEKACIFAHEAGHGLGLAHSNINGHHDSPGQAHTPGTTIMRGGEHGERCHVANPPRRPRGADVNDVAAYY